MATKWLSIQPSQQDLWNKAIEQKYVWIKTNNNFIVKDELCPWCQIKTFLYNVYLKQENYGKTWAFTKEELLKEEMNNNE